MNDIIIALSVIALYGYCLTTMALAKEKSAYENAKVFLLTQIAVCCMLML